MLDENKFSPTTLEEVDQDWLKNSMTSLGADEKLGSCVVVISGSC
jgi:hypothetical protein